MNMFRDILILALMTFGIGIAVSNPTDWSWINLLGPGFVQALVYVAAAKPFSSIICFALALALFMTRLKY